MNNSIPKLPAWFHRPARQGFALAMLLACALAVSCPGASSAPAQQDSLSASNPGGVTGDRTGLNGTTHAMAYDGSLTTFFRSSFSDWQYLQVDFGEAGRFTGLRRYMTSNGTNTAGGRTNQGEIVQHSMDGVTWIELTGANARGWAGYINYGARRPPVQSEWLTGSVANRESNTLIEGVGKLSVAPFGLLSAALSKTRANARS